MNKRRFTAPALVAGTLTVLFAGACASPNPLAHMSGANQGSPSPASPAGDPTLAAAAPATPNSVSGCGPGTVVTTAAGLGAALSTAAAGTEINLAPGTFAGQFVAEASGTQQAPITLCGTRASILDGGENKSGYVLHLNGTSWWRVTGFAVQGGQKGVVTDHASHVLISGLYVHDIGDEAIHLRSFSSDNTVEANTIRRTGTLRAKFGEGIYVGSASANWCKYSACKPDTSDRNVIRNNDISETTAENIDIKEGTTGGSIVGNHLSGIGMVASAAGAWINVKGNSWTITGNAGRTSVKDGFQVHEVYAGWGRNNVFRQNSAQVDGPGYGYYIQHSQLGTVLACDNTAAGAAKGLSNRPCGT